MFGPPGKGKDDQRRGVRRDLWGFVDVVVVKPDGLLFIQCTSATGISSRVRKIFDSEIYDERVSHLGLDVEVWGWGTWKVGKRDRWAARRVALRGGESFELGKMLSGGQWLDSVGQSG